MNTCSLPRVRPWLAIALLAFAPILASAQAPAAGGLRAGAAKVDISPDPATFAIATDTIRDPLYVRAIYVENGQASAVIVSVDVGGLSDEIVNAAIAESSAATGCPPANYLISATHTHSSGGTQAERTAAAIVSAVNEAKSRLAPARIGYGTAQLDLNVNRDLYNAQQEWRQGPNPQGVSDKTLAVVGFVGADGVPIAVYMNYGMHPINFYQSGVVSADFPGEASRNVEELFEGRTVALFSQAASGDQNPRLGYSPPYSTGAVRRGQPAPLITVAPPIGGNGGTGAGALAPTGAARGAQPAAGRGFNPATAAAERTEIPANLQEDYQKVLGRVGDYATMLGQMIGTTAVRVMREDMEWADDAPIWGGFERFSVPGRIRNDAADPARENVFPGYSDGPDVNIRVGLLRIGEVHFVSVNAEIYTDIGLAVKSASPASKTLVVSLANGRANSGYIYSDNAYHHLTFQVIGSRVQPGFAEAGIVSHAADLVRRSTRP
jgi:neutral ceramidase